MITAGETLALPSEFWEHVTVGSPVECWTWKGATTYPMWRGQNASRLALASRTPMPAIRRQLDPGERSYWWALHHCDNPPCVNPDHLYWGTPAQNIADHFTRAARCSAVTPNLDRQCKARASCEVDGVPFCGMHRKVALRGGTAESAAKTARLKARIERLERDLLETRARLEQHPAYERDKRIEAAKARLRAEFGDPITVWGRRAGPDAWDVVIGMFTHTGWTVPDA